MNDLVSFCDLVLLNSIVITAIHDLAYCMEVSAFEYSPLILNSL